MAADLTPQTSITLANDELELVVEVDRAGIPRITRLAPAGQDGDGAGQGGTLLSSLTGTSLPSGYPPVTAAPLTPYFFTFTAASSTTTLSFLDDLGNRLVQGEPVAVLVPVHVLAQVAETA